ncbi:NYN domain-containing protein [Actinoplanes sp. NPDC023936]|uniref:NYN domain-containing protein n=1 Tax=Actinoplanes sp. NPDC023936 TaxID=3154910 RepID=UPI0033E132A3
MYEPEELVGWLHASALRMGVRFLRAYWYDGAYEPGAPLFQQQREKFARLESSPGLQLGLGHLQKRKFDYKPALRKAAEEMGIDYQELMRHFQPEAIYQQKGVDSLIVLDMVRLVQQGSCSHVMLMAGDRDLAEAVRTVQQLGATVTRAFPDGAPVANEVRNLADEVVIWGPETLERLTKPFMERFANLLGYDPGDGEEDD